MPPPRLQTTSRLEEGTEPDRQMHSQGGNSRAGCYEVIVDNIKEDFLIDTSMLHYAQVQVKYDTQELYRKGKVVKGVARIKR